MAIYFNNLKIRKTTVATDAWKREHIIITEKMWVKWIVLFSPLSDSINFYNGAPAAIINLILSATDKSDKYDIS